MLLTDMMILDKSVSTRPRACLMPLLHHAYRRNLLAQRMPVHSVEDFGRAVVEDNAGPLFRPDDGELGAAYAADDSRIAVHCRSSVSISSSAGAPSRFLLS